MKKNTKFVDFVKKQNFIKELKLYEHIILWTTCVLSLAFFITQLVLFKDAITDWTIWLTMFASISSIMFLISGSKKKIICPIIGLIGAIFLFATSWERHLFGFVIMQGCNIATQIVTLIFWVKHSENKSTIKPKRLPLWFVLVYTAIFVGLSFAFAWMEGQDWFYKFWSGDPHAISQPYSIRIFESLSLMLIVGTFFPMIKGYSLTWWLYAMCDVTMAITWLLRALTSAEGGLVPEVFNCWSTFASNICMLVTCVIPILNWRKKVGKNETKK